MQAQTAKSIDKAQVKSDKLAVLWTSGDPDVAHKVCLMYTHAAKKMKWFNEVVLIVWGPSSRLLATDKSLQKKVKQMKEDGIKVRACIVCANMYGVTDELKQLGVEVLPMGVPLTNYLKEGYHTLTF
ncbi:DsrE family protein [Prolixibacteraceae bacterium JC049]|nr:DsrE family protein [Prolixibacteraceae bacterium JC049]